jgi:uncharacterized protein YecE (DUF72 family)
VSTIWLGCAGWSLPRESAAAFPVEGSHLARYAARFSAVEINSSFYRPHRPATYARWAETVPEGFRFAVKIPKAITHEAKLEKAERTLTTFLGEVGELGEKLGCLLVQLPPSLVWKPKVAQAFFATLRERFDGAVACEPRHPTWFEPDVDESLRKLRVARVAADPARVPAAAEPAGWDGVVYVRLHGSPRIYYSTYDAAYLDGLAETLAAHRKRGATVWCIFDNTALGAATANALELDERLRKF